MTKGRLEAFSDAVIAIIMTIMVLELRAPEGPQLALLVPVIPVLLSYVLSFVFLGIYWNNHHHLLQAVQQVNGTVLWANLHLLLWLSFIPFVTSWLGSSGFSAWPVALYGAVLLFSGSAFLLLARALVALHGVESQIAIALGRDFKGKLSLVSYLIAIALAFVAPWLSCAVYVIVAAVWLIPDTRIERAVRSGTARE
jgi:uncharacterized membrane protein